MSQTLTESVAAEIRAVMGRMEVPKSELARRLGVSEVWVGRRVRGKLDLSVADLERIAAALSVPVSTFLPASERVA